MKNDTVGLYYADTDDIVLTFFAENREVGFLELIKLKNQLREKLNERAELCF